MSSRELLPISMMLLLCLVIFPLLNNYGRQHQLPPVTNTLSYSVASIFLRDQSTVVVLRKSGDSLIPALLSVTNYCGQQGTMQIFTDVPANKDDWVKVTSLPACPLITLNGSPIFPIESLDVHVHDTSDLTAGAAMPVHGAKGNLLVPTTPLIKLP